MPLSIRNVSVYDEAAFKGRKQVTNLLHFGSLHSEISIVLPITCQDNKAIEDNENKIADRHTGE